MKLHFKNQRQPLVVALLITLLMSISGAVRAEVALLYPGAESYPAIYTGAEPFSDHDEAGSSKTKLSLKKAPSDSPAGDAVTVLHIDFDMPENTALGYQYAGVAFGFKTPQPLDLTGAIRIMVRSSNAVKIIPDVSDSVKGRRALKAVDLPAMKWTAIAMPASEFDHLIHKEIDHVALSILEPAKGSLEIYSVEIPLDASVGPAPAPPLANTPAARVANSPLLASAVVFTDAAESASSKTVATLRAPAATGTGDTSQDAAVSLQYNIPKNESLGYQYAGAEFAISPAVDLKDAKEISLTVRSDVDITGAEAIIMDKDRKKARFVLDRIEHGQWQTLNVPLKGVSAINLSQVSYISIAVTAASSGTLEISRANYPVAPALVDSLRKTPAAGGAVQ